MAGLFLVCMCLPVIAFADVILGSWNIQNLGWNNDKRFDKLAHVVDHFDFLAIQELMNEEALERLEEKVETLSGESWSSMASHALGRSTYREHYAFLWRDSAVEYVEGAVVFIDSSDVFAREPYSAKFRSKRSGQAFAVGNIHVVYGRSVGDRLPEIAALVDYWDWLEEIYPGIPRLLMGDFNLAPHHQAWQLLRDRGVIPAITAGATTLSPTAGRYANLYDNIWKVSGELDIPRRGIVEFPALFGIDHVRARDVVSDHAPVYISLGNAELALRPFTSAAIASMPAANEATYCIDLNRSSQEALQTLPHIGPARVQGIIDRRPWQSAEQLSRLSGIGPGRLADILNSGLLCK
ncbi:MAG: endonuclease [Halomonadaceae bacterium]|nr:MAG: endonuclease [Halomonadaceae bacterium]